MNNQNYRRFLLFHPQANLTYIRRLSMSYGYYTSLAVVNENDRVTHIGLSNSFQIVPFKKLSNEDKKILGDEKCHSLDPDDLLSVYRITRALKLNGSFKLYRPCRNMRYTSVEETNYLKRMIKYTLNESKLVINEQENINYDTPYSDQVDIDLWNLDLTEVEEIEIPTFDKICASGQTKLI